MTVRVYGQAPGPGQQGRPGVPFSGSGRLADLAGVTPETLAERGWMFRNLLDYYPGPNDDGSGDLFPMWEARRAAALERLAWQADDRILLMGRRVAAAFRAELPYFEWTRLIESGVDVAVFPHPSGRNRYWNSGERADAARAFLREMVEVYV
jgi:hypothetical protein